MFGNLDKKENREDIVSYGLLPHPINDPKRKLMLINFYDSENLQEGKEIIDNALVDKMEQNI